MCVRYTLHKTDAALNAISQALGSPLEVPDWAEPRYNVSLTAMMPVVAQEESKPSVRAMRWGFIPAAERDSLKPRLIANARAETAATFSVFRKAIATRRCLVPANGFYEWRSVGSAKLPHLFTLKDEEPFAFAGIWDMPEGRMPETYCVLTTEPNALVAPIHDRMPVILTRETMKRWLGAEPLDPGELRSLLRPLGAERMAVRPVSRFVSNSRNEGPLCLAPPEDPLPEPELDFG